MTHYDDTVRGPVPTPEEVWRELADTPQQTLKVKRLHDDAVMPEFATNGSAGFDLVAVNKATVYGQFATTIDTGLAFEIPRGHALLIFSRSGHGFTHGLRLCNSVGLIDSDYRGEVKVKLHNDSHRDFVVNPGDRIAQAVLVPIPRVSLVEVYELSDTERGAGGFGSTGR